MNYIVKKGDTLYRIAQKHNTTVGQLLRNNPGIKNPNVLYPGQVINIDSSDDDHVVQIKDKYGYEDMQNDLKELKKIYPEMQLVNTGSSVLGRSIPAVRLGYGPKEVHYNGSFHANEWITTVLLMRFIEEYLKANREKRSIGDFYIPDLHNKTSLWIVPLVNPDGVDLVQNGIQPQEPFYEEVIRLNGGSRSFRNWKANIRGVDLNDQFPASWDQEFARRETSGPAPENYPGPYPLSEPEAQAIAAFTREHNFRLVIAFHTQGEVIFWGYKGFEPAESQSIVRKFQQVSGYEPIRYVESDAGYKDWFIQDWRRPGFTVECGKGQNPLPISQFWDIFNHTIGLLLIALTV